MIHFGMPMPGLQVSTDGEGDPYNDEHEPAVDGKSGEEGEADYVPIEETDKQPKPGTDPAQNEQI